MHPLIEKLLVIQDRDCRLMMFEREKRSLPIERLGIEGRLKSAKDAFEQVRDRSRHIELERKKLEMDAQAKRDSIGKFRGQQAQTRRNEEYQALASEIRRHEDLIKGIEDRELELMDEAEQFKPKLAAAEAALKAAEKLTIDSLATLENRSKALEAAIATLKDERAALTADVPEDVLYRYTRLLASKGDRAVVGVDHEVCSGCHMKITTQTVVRVKGGKELVQCEQCGRILYIDEFA